MAMLCKKYGHRGACIAISTEMLYSTVVVGIRVNTHAQLKISADLVPIPGGGLLWLWLAAGALLSLSLLQAPAF